MLAKPEEFAEVMGLHDVHVTATTKDSLAYVGFEFGCSWEDEHGFGVLTHGVRVIETGSADVAFSPTRNADKDDGMDLDGLIDGD